MSEIGQGPKRPEKSTVKVAAVVIVVLLGVAAAYGALIHRSKPGLSLKPLATGAMAKLEPTDPPGATPAKPFEGPDGKPGSVAGYKGKVTVVNLWATWCAPCREEMPTLARLQAAYAGKPVVIVPLSVDRGKDVEKAKAFIAQNAPLRFHHAPMAWAFALKPAAVSFPTTIIYDKAGRERARLARDADWSSKEARAVIDRLLTEGSEAKR